MSLYAQLRKVLERFYFSGKKKIVPDLRDSQFLYVDKLSSIVDEHSYWLDLGCGHRIVPAWTKFDETQLCHRAKFIVGVDRDANSLKRHKNIHFRVIADLDALPFRDGVFNLVTANMVVEHLRHPKENLGEIAKILQPGGLFVFHTVNILHYNARISSLLPQRLKIWLVRFLENRREEDVYPTHYCLNTRNSIQARARDTGFEVREIDMMNSSPETIMLGPVVLLELLLIRLLNRPQFARWRSNVIAVLRRPAAEATADREANVATCAAGSVSPW